MSSRVKFHRMLLIEVSFNFTNSNEVQTMNFFPISQLIRDRLDGDKRVRFGSTLSNYLLQYIEKLLGMAAIAIYRSLPNGIGSTNSISTKF